MAMKNITKFSLTLSLCLIFTLIALFAKSISAQSSASENQYIVVLKETEKDPPGIAKKMSADYSIKTKHVYKQVIKGFSAIIPSDKLEKVRSDKRVKYVAEDRLVEINAKKVKPTRIPTPTNTPTTSPLSIRVVTPNGGEVLERGQTYRITWEAPAQIDMVTLGYKACDSCLDWIVNNIANTGYYDWTVNVGNTTNTLFKIYIIGYDTGVGSVTDTSDNSFTVLQPTPTPSIWLQVKTPNGGEALHVGQTYGITWNSDPRIDKVTIGYKACESCLDWIAYNVANTGWYTWNVNTASTISTQYLIDITGYWTGYGSVNDKSDNYFNVIQPTLMPTIVPTVNPTSIPTATPIPTGQIIPLGIKRIDAITSGTSYFSVAVLDTGVDLDHPDLKENILIAVDCTSGTCIAGGDDDHGHGTHVTGTIAARNNNIGVVGVEPMARIVSIKILDKNGSGYWSQIIAGIDWLTANASKYHIKVVNMSLGGSGISDNNCGYSNNDPFHQAICTSVATGITYVVAAGNDATDVSSKVPAGYNDTVITVSALVDTDGLPGGLGAGNGYGADDTFASFSNYGLVVDLGAPGVNVYSTVKDGLYGYKSGTSMASPHVAGAALRYLMNNPGSSWQQVLSGLKAIAEQLNNGHTDPSGKHPEPVVMVTGL